MEKSTKTPLLPPSMQAGQCAPSSSFMSLLSVCILCLMHVAWGLDQVTLLNPPEEPLPGHLLNILYSCDDPATVHLDCTVTLDTGVTSTIPLKQWSCVPGDPRIRNLELKLPDWLVYQADGIVPDRQVLNCILLASVRHTGSDESVAAREVATLHPRPFFDRPIKQHQLCFSWSAQMLQITQQYSTKQCPLEQGKFRKVGLNSISASYDEALGPR